MNTGIIYCGDCLDIMRGMADNSVDAVITDPPYGIGFHYNGKAEMNRNPDDYWQWLSPRVAEIERIAKPGAFIAIWQTQLYFPYFWGWFGSDIHIYAACKNFVQIRRGAAFTYAYDPVVMWYTEGERLASDDPKRNLDWSIGNTANITQRPSHPCPRPLNQVSEIMENFTSPDALVLDPFFGSGTVGVAAERLGRRWIGIELSPEYCELARKRTAQRGLFMEGGE